VRDVFKSCTCRLGGLVIRPEGRQVMLAWICKGYGMRAAKVAGLDKTNEHCSFVVRRRCGQD
jgi:hypothetical protein